MACVRPQVLCQQKKPLNTTQALQMLCKEQCATCSMPCDPKPGDIYLYKGRKCDDTASGWKCDGQKWEPAGIYLVPNCPELMKLFFNLQYCNPFGHLVTDTNFKKHVFVREKCDCDTVFALVHYIKCVDGGPCGNNDFPSPPANIDNCCPPVCPLPCPAKRPNPCCPKQCPNSCCPKPCCPPDPCCPPACPPDPCCPPKCPNPCCPPKCPDPCCPPKCAGSCCPPKCPPPCCPTPCCQQNPCCPTPCCPPPPPNPCCPPRCSCCPKGLPPPCCPRK